MGVVSFAKLIAFPGQLYLFFLQMTVIPIIVTAIASSLGKLMRNKSSAGLVRRIVLVFVVCMIACALIGMAAGMFGKPGAGLSDDTRSLLSNLLSASEEEGADSILEITLGAGGETTAAASRPGMDSFFTSLIPSNIFNALSQGSIMAIVFFSIILGIAIGFLQEESALLLIKLFSAVFEAFQKLIGWSLYLLPFGLVCLLAGQIADVGVQIFVAMSKFIILYCAGTFVIFVVCTIIMWIRSGNRNPLKVVSVLFEPILLAFATRNSMATLPSAITCLDNKLKFNTTAVNLTLPLGMTLGRFGNIFYFGLGVFFVAQIYNTQLELIHYCIMLVGVIFAGTATAGASGIVTLSMLGIVLEPLGLPLEAVLIIFMAIDPIIDPFRTFLIVYVNMAATSLVAGRGEDKEDSESLGGGMTADSNGNLSSSASRDNEKQLLVYIRETNDTPPLLVRSGKSLGGYETAFLKEIARRIGRKLVVTDEERLDSAEREKAMRQADMMAGLITEEAEAPRRGFYRSLSWATVSSGGIKTSFYFLLSGTSECAAAIDGVIQNLKAEHFLTSLAGSAPNNA